MAQLGFHDFTVGSTLTAALMDGVMRQTTMYFADYATMLSDLSGVEEEGMFCYTAAGDNFWYYNGTDFVPFMSTWATWTPVWTNLSAGNGTVSAQYRYTGSEMRCRGVFVLGSTSSVTGSPIQFTIPNSETSAATGGGSIGSAFFVDASATAKPYSGITVVSASDTLVSFVGSDDNYTSASTPFTWTTSDTIRWDLHIAL